MSMVHLKVVSNVDAYWVEWHEWEGHKRIGRGLVVGSRRTIKADATAVLEDMHERLLAAAIEVHRLADEDEELIVTAAVSQVEATTGRVLRMPI